MIAGNCELQPGRKGTKGRSQSCGSGVRNKQGYLARAKYSRDTAHVTAVRGRKRFSLFIYPPTFSQHSFWQSQIPKQSGVILPCEKRGTDIRYQLLPDSLFWFDDPLLLSDSSHWKWLLRYNSTLYTPVEIYPMPEKANGIPVLYQY